MSKVVLKGYIQVSDSDLAAVLAELDRHIVATRSELGNICFEITQDTTNPTRFNVYEEFINKQAFEKHQARIIGSDWERVTRSAERHYQISIKKPSR